MIKFISLDSNILHNIDYLEKPIYDNKYKTWYILSDIFVSLNNDYVDKIEVMGVYGVESFDRNEIDEINRFYMIEDKYYELP